MKSCPVVAWEIVCDVLVACLGLAQTREGHALPPGTETLVENRALVPVPEGL
jgi:hypothetical protein